MVIKLKSDRDKRNNDYTKLKRKVFFRVLLIVFATIATVIFLRDVIQDNFNIGESIVEFLKNKFYLSESDAVIIYRYIFLYNKELITLIVIIILLIILLRFSISWFTKYFDEIGSGMDKLVEESNDEITLSPELDFMENKLNQIKNNLEKQKKLHLMPNSAKMIWSFIWHMI